MRFDFKDVSVNYGALPALHHCSFALSSGDNLVVTGHTGSGKTTLLKLMYGEIAPTSGDFAVNGQLSRTIKKSQWKNLRSAMGIVFQNDRLIESLSTVENVSLPLMLSGKSARLANSQALSILTKMGISYLRNSHPASLSGGEKHLVGLARAVVGNPKIVIADEPTGNLDPSTSEMVVRTLLDEAIGGTSVIVSTHSPSLVEAFRLTASVLELAEGNIVSFKRPVSYSFQD